MFWNLLGGVFQIFFWSICFSLEMSSLSLKDDSPDAPASLSTMEIDSLLLDSSSDCEMVVSDFECSLPSIDLDCSSSSDDTIHS